MNFLKDRLAARPESGMNAAMTFHQLLRALIGTSLVCFMAGCGGGDAKSEPSQPGQRTAQEVLDGMRLKQLTKELTLSEEQQAKLKALYDAEAKEIARIQEDANLSVTDRSVKITALHKETREKIKPLLDPTQLTKFEQWVSKSEKRRRN